jgi:hypothetical protein
MQRKLCQLNGCKQIQGEGAKGQGLSVLELFLIFLQNFLLEV